MCVRVCVCRVRVCVLFMVQPFKVVRITPATSCATRLRKAMKPGPRGPIQALVGSGPRKDEGKSADCRAESKLQGAEAVHAERCYRGSCPRLQRPHPRRGSGLHSPAEGPAAITMNSRKSRFCGRCQRKLWAMPKATAPTPQRGSGLHSPAEGPVAITMHSQAGSLGTVPSSMSPLQSPNGL